VAGQLTGYIPWNLTLHIYLNYLKNKLRLPYGKSELFV